jgi:hypothetical protein
MPGSLEEEEEEEEEGYQNVVTKPRVPSPTNDPFSTGYPMPDPYADPNPIFPIQDPGSSIQLHQRSTPPNLIERVTLQNFD